MTLLRRRNAMVAAVLTGLLVVPAPALAAGPGGGGGGGGGGGEPTDTTGSLYSDLVVALRAENGTPVLKKYVVPGEAEDPPTTEFCVQPVSYEKVPGVTAQLNPLDGRDVWVLPLQGEWLTVQPDPLPVAEIEACDPQPQYAMFVSEAELERLNLARTSEAVIADKLAGVETRLRLAEEITLDGAGRITTDGVPIDASPDQAAIYGSLTSTGTIPGLPAGIASPPAHVGIFDAWELAAAAIGTAASKPVPITVDTVLYYNRIIGLPPAADYVSPWEVTFNRSLDPETEHELTEGEQFVDYSGFSYQRSETFKGSVTWLDVPKLTWQVSRIADVVPFTNLTNAPIGDRTLTGVTGFAQLADDVRAVINYLHENEVVPGFYIDPVGVDTTAAQEDAIRQPAVDLGNLPENVFQTLPFEVQASLFNPWAGTLVDEARLKITVDAGDDLTVDDLAAVAEDQQSVPFTDVDGNLVGWWGPENGFPVPPGYQVGTTSDVKIAGGAPEGPYAVTLELVDVDDLSTPLASDTGTINVNANVATLLWGGTVPGLVTQGTFLTVPVRVYAPVAGAGELTLTVTGPGDDPSTPYVAEKPLAVGDVSVYGDNGTDMVAMPLTLDEADDQLVGGWSASLVEGLTDITWYLVVADGAPVGGYQIDVDLAGGVKLLEPAVVAVTAPEAHGQQPPGAGEDETAPTVTLTVLGDLSSSATFAYTADEPDVTYQCRLTKDGVAGPLEDCTVGNSKSYTGLAPGAYVFSIVATDLAGNVSLTHVTSWVVATVPAAGTTPTTPVVPGASGTASPTPETTIVKGPKDHSWVLAKRVAYRLSSNGADTQYRVTLNGETTTACSTERCVVEGLRSGTNRLEFAATRAGKVDRTPVVRTLSVPRGVLSLAHTKAWNMQRAEGHLFGAYAQSRDRGEVIRTRSERVKRIALVVSTGPGYGKIHVYVGDRRLTDEPISLRSRTMQTRQLVPVKTFGEATRGAVRVVVVSTGKTVRVEGIGIASR